ncbi:MAG: hypothetical protein IT160_13125 [Bryobacterales bacterium]|nr:hypothetical protein [Bryobacterales bacterium]
MPLPETIRVKLSSEGAEAIAITPVVVRQMPFGELIEEILAVTGKDHQRIHATLRRGSFISGGTRYRWEPHHAGIEELTVLLRSFPDSDPGRPFDRQCCARVILRAASQRVEFPREAALGHRLFRRRTFWDTLMELIGEEAPVYVEYSYRDRADRYRLVVRPSAAARLRGESELMKFPTLARRIHDLAVESIEFLVERR